MPRRSALPSTAPARLTPTLAGLSGALDLAAGRAPGHAARSALLGADLARRLGLPAEDRRAVLHVLLLQDAGRTDAAPRPRATAPVHGFPGGRPRLALRRGAGAGSPPRRGLRLLPDVTDATGPVVPRGTAAARTAAAVGLPAGVADALRHLEERWDGAGLPRGLAGEAIPRVARVAAVARAAEAALARQGLDAARRHVRRGRSRALDPGVADAFLAIPADGCAWREVLDAGDPAGWGGSGDDRPLDDAGLDAAVGALAAVVDARGPWTAGHGERVAATADAIAARLGLGPAARRDVRRAALLRDLGMLDVPVAVLQRPGGLSAPEWAHVHRHPGTAAAILVRTPGLRSLAPLVAAHHERLDGTGYPRGLAAPDLSLPARVVAVADVAVSLAADRPHRPALSGREADAVLRRAAGVSLDAACVEVLVGAGTERLAA